nr:MAG TPA: Paired amphipathic helix protein [Caudoviricetes sp.]
MLTTIHITVRDRVPTITAGEDVITHNSDYVAEFVFDEEWQDKVKTVYFVCEDGSYQAVVMSGHSCGVPMLDGEHRRIFVGVQAGAAEKPSILKTTRPCCLKVRDSIADLLGQSIPDPTPDVYQQIMALLEDIKQGEVSPEDIQKAVNKYLTENPISVDIATTEKAGIVAVGKNLSITKNGVLSVDTTDSAEQDNTKPITSAGVNLVVGNINALLAII